MELQRKEQELMQMQAKMKTVEEQHADYQKHIAVLKESLIAKEEHYNMLQLDVSQFILPETRFILPSPKNLNLNKSNHMSCRKRLDLGNKIHNRAWNRSRESWHDHELFHLLLNYNNKIYIGTLFSLISLFISQTIIDFRKKE